MDDRDKDVVAENIGAALRFGVLPDSALVARKLAQAQMFVVATPAYLARKGVPRTQRTCSSTTVSSLAIRERTGSSGVGIWKPMCLFQGG